MLNTLTLITRDYAEIKYQTSASSAKSASKILNQIEWCDTSHPTVVQEHLSEIQKGGTRFIVVQSESRHPARGKTPPYKLVCVALTGLENLSAFLPRAAALG